MENNSPKAALMVIGNEILSGRTQDINLNFIAKKLACRGIILKEARVIEDDKNVIIETVNLLREKFDYVFTTGGIGPTHDDITTRSIAEAFGVGVKHSKEAIKALDGYYKAQNKQLNESRLKMAEIPEGAKLINNYISGAPGYSIENVYVMAGVPKIMQSMMKEILPELKVGNMIHTKDITIEGFESEVAHILDKVQKQYPNVDIGSYPFKNGVNIVMRSIYDDDLNKVYDILSEQIL